MKGLCESFAVLVQVKVSACSHDQLALYARRDQANREQSPQIHYSALAPRFEEQGLAFDGGIYLSQSGLDRI